ncbi:asparagine synthase (glutamine-hydrolysing) [Streptomyces sp. Ag82_O1-15]|uniref:asparagine synthase-related protein n=1 Tax=Streptomyces sp. Ag82_O1-15 TaxID=1938855 RepID=UPI000BDB4982|nr:asparagine synthase-related protein [Streptomyces sp. Ag82_O1-15]PBC92462.1 asparagine synthase (glutamine-hydrolysing) [Streptomyces sp. Ag82_O1-15]
MNYFTVTHSPDRLEIELAPAPSGPDSLVSVAAFDGNVALLYGYLLYRRRAAARLDTASTRQDDAELALASYQESGVAGLERLEGDFALVVWDADEQRIIGIRDPMGGYPLFYRHDGDTIAFGTSLRRLHQSAAQGLDMDYVARFLAMPAQLQELNDVACVRPGIRRILPGTVVVAAARRHDAVLTRRYWNWQERMTDFGTDDVDELGDAYRSILSDAVRQRVRGRTLSHLSGGTDSSAVSLLARDAARDAPRAEPLHTVSLIYQQLPVLRRETAYIDEVLRTMPDVTAHRLPADGLLDFDAFTDPPDYEEPYAGLWRVQLDRASVDLADRLGAKTLLTGIGSDEVHDIQPYHIADLLRRGRAVQSVREAQTWAEDLACNWWEIFVPFGITPLTHTGTRTRRGPSTSSIALRDQADHSVPRWFDQDFVSAYDIADRIADAARSRFRRGLAAGLATTLAAIEWRAGDTLRWAVAAPVGLCLGHPFLDPRVLAAGLGIRARLRPQPGTRKPVLATALNGLLPAALLERRRKGHFNEVYYLGLARNTTLLQRMINNAPDATWQVFDRQAIIDSLTEAQVGGGSVRQLARLSYSLSLVSWLSSDRAATSAARRSPAASARPSPSPQGRPTDLAESLRRGGYVILTP